MRAEVTVVVVDGLANALAEHGRSEDKAGDALWFLRGFCRPLAIAGAGVVVLHHVTKDPAGRGGGKWGRGSGAILGEADLSFSLEMVEPFARGHSGSARLRVAKDRHGSVGPEGSIVATVTFTANSDERLSVELQPAAGASAKWNGPTECMAAVLDLLEKTDGELSITQMNKVLRFHKGTISDAAERLALSPSEPVAVRKVGRAYNYRFEPTLVCVPDEEL